MSYRIQRLNKILWFMALCRNLVWKDIVKVKFQGTCSTVESGRGLVWKDLLEIFIGKNLDQIGFKF